MDSLRPLLTTYAYNIVGSFEDAKDIVQDAFLKFLEIDGEKLENKNAYLIRIVINLSINFKNRQKKLIARYPGEWLPEPIATERADGAINRKEILSYSLMVLLEKLDARQRAVFIMKEAFDYEHAEIANVLGISIDNSRKLLSRAKLQLQSAIPIVDKDIPADYLNKFLEAVQNGDTSQLEQLLIEDVTIIADGGGKATAFINPIIGYKSAVNVLLGLHKRFFYQVTTEEGSVNNQPALFYYEKNTLVACLIFSLKNAVIENLFIIRNPDKLKNLQKRF